MGRDPPWEVSFASDILGSSRRQVPLAGWRATGTNSRAEGSQDSAHEECACSLLRRVERVDGEFGRLVSPD